jgi:hypothetical protein
MLRGWWRSGQARATRRLFREETCQGYAQPLRHPISSPQPPPTNGQSRA